MNAERINATRKYAAALRVVKAAELGSDLAAWQAADAALAHARTALVAAEIKWPTKAETSRERRTIMMSNRGLRK
jgi:DMSO/TMAO reductase YedYZ molybdopterin-dependent catalytic subunit